MQIAFVLRFIIQVLWPRVIANYDQSSLLEHLPGGIGKNPWESITHSIGIFLYNNARNRVQSITSNQKC